GSRDQGCRPEGALGQEPAAQHLAGSRRAHLPDGGSPGRRGAGPGPGGTRRESRSRRAAAPMNAPAPAPDAALDSIVAIPELRDYERINAELVQRLDGGISRVRLQGAEGQRLLLAGLAGGGSALAGIEGGAGGGLGGGL